MKTLSIREMRSQLGNLDHLVETEHEIIITRHGKPIARLLPVQGRKQKLSHRELRNALPPLKVASEILQRDDREQR
jgi:prevent-host-death family protein